MFLSDSLLKFSSPAYVNLDVLTDYIKNIFKILRAFMALLLSKGRTATLGGSAKVTVGKRIIVSKEKSHINFFNDIPNPSVLNSKFRRAAAS